MEAFESDDGHVLVRLDPGDLALETIREVCREYEVRAGGVVSGIATLRNLNVHYVPTDEFPDEKSERNEYLELDGAWEVSCIDGAIADYEPHLHVTAYNGEETIGAHLEAGCETHIQGEVLLRRIEGLDDVTRAKNEKNVTALTRRPSE
jgi:predicted DNA-binding protein with PD1-like motif